MFDDGLYAEHGTFGISDWMSRIDAPPADAGTRLDIRPDGPASARRTYIMQGPVIPLDSPEARSERPWPAERSHRYALLAHAPASVTPGGTMYRATQARFPITAMAGLLIQLQPGAMQQIHWHPDANEMHYVASGRVRMTMFAPEKRLSVAELGPGDCAYVPANCGHTLQNVGDAASDIISVVDTPNYQEATLLDWLQKAPPHLLHNNLGSDQLAFQVVPGSQPVARR